MSAKPRVCLERLHLIGSDFLIFLDCVAPILPDGICEWSVIRKDRTLLPTVGKLIKPTQRERLDEHFLQPLTRIAWFTVSVPAIGQDMAKLVAKLIGELGPISWAHIDDNGGGRAAVVVEPNRRITRTVIFNPEPARLPIGKEPHSGKAYLAHTENDSRHVPN